MRSNKKEITPEKEQNRTPTRKRSLARSGLLLGVLLILLLLAESPRLQSLRGTAAYLLAGKLLLTAIAAYFAWFHPSAQGMPWEGRACMMLGTCILFTVFLPERTAVLADVMIYAAQAVLLVLTLTRGLYAGPGIMLCLTPVKLLSVNLQMWSFAANRGGIHFWKAAAVGTLVVSLGAYFLIRYRIIRLKDDRRSERIACVVLTAMMGFAGIWSSLMNLNYALDTSLPQTYETKVTGRHVSTGKSTTYYLQVYSPEGMLEVRVSENEYTNTESGHPGTLERYRGAFDDPYYVLYLDGQQ